MIFPNYRSPELDAFSDPVTLQVTTKLLPIGALLYLCAITYGYWLEVVMQDVLTNLNLSLWGVLWGSIVVGWLLVAAIVLGVVLLLSRKTSKGNGLTWRFIWFLAIVWGLGQAGQFFYTLNTEQWTTPESYLGLAKYRKQELLDHPLITMISHYVDDIIVIGVFIWYAWKERS